MKHLKFAVPALLAGLLIACGGGGGSSSSSGTDYTSKYVGTWKSGCYQDARFTDTTTTPSAAAYVTDTYAFTTSSTSKLAFTYTQTIYGGTDTMCAKTALTTFTRTGNSATYAGTASVTGTTGAENWDLTYVAYGNGSIISGGSITINGVSYKSADVAGGTTKGLLYVNGSSLKLTTSTTAYPTAHGTSAANTLTKQQ